MGGASYLAPFTDSGVPLAGQKLSKIIFKINQNYLSHVW